MMKWTAMESPVGVLRLSSDGAGLTRLTLSDFQDDERGDGTAERGDDAVLQLAVAQLTEYFAGTRKEFDLPLRPLGTAFQYAVWEELQRIPFGVTASYGEIADRIGRPSAVRAVARANATNRIGIVIPCHRVIGANGTLTGYAAGVERKAWLLDHEGAELGLLASSMGKSE